MSANTKSSHDDGGGSPIFNPADDYNGMGIEEWKAALMQDVQDRFGPTPDDLMAASEAGW